VASVLAEDDQAVTYLQESRYCYFGYPALEPAEALLRALRLRRVTGVRIKVGTKANSRYDAMFSSLAQHVGEECLLRLFHGAVVFSSLEAYIVVYANRPTRLLQPKYRARMGYAPFVGPSRQAHDQFIAELHDLRAPDDDG
jgi:hypothetical protein